MIRRLDLLDRPIFIVGAQRSGTTLLRLMLDAHPDVAIGPETAFARGIEAVVESPFFSHGEHWYLEYGWTREQVEREAAALYGEVFSSWARSMGAVRWGEKTPLHRYYIPRLVQWFPDAQFIGLVRHPGAVASSRARWDYEWERTVGDWEASGRSLLHATELLPPDQVLLLRYEDLLADPRPAMQRVLGFLDLRWSDHVLEHHVAPRAKVRERLALGGTDTAAGIDPSKAHAWARTATDDERTLLADREPLLADWGYRLDDPFHVEPGRAGHADLLTRSPAPSPPRTATEDAPAAQAATVDPTQMAAELEASRRAREALIARVDTMTRAAEADRQREREDVERLRGQLDRSERRLAEVRESFDRFRGRRSVRAAVRLMELLGR